MQTVARLTQCRLPQRGHSPVHKPLEPLFQRVVPAFAQIHFSGCLNPKERFPSGIVRWDGDPHAVADSRLFGHNGMKAWGPVPAGADRREWYRSMNSVAATLLREAWKRDPALVEGFGELRQETIYAFADHFIARLPYEWEFEGQAVLDWIHTGVLPDFCCCTPEMRDQAEADVRRAEAAFFAQRDPRRLIAA